MAQSMQILMVAPHVPGRSWGASTRSYYLLQALARQHTVSLLVLADSPLVETNNHALEGIQLHALQHIVFLPSTQSKRTQQMFSMLKGRSYILDSYAREGVQTAIDTMFAQNHYDAVLLESVFMAGYHFPEQVPVIIDQHNIEHELLYRTYQHETSWSRKWYNWWESLKIKPIELERCRKARGILVTSKRECLLLRRLLPESTVAVVPNGVDITAFNIMNAVPEVAQRIIFTGTMNYYPNIDAALFFAQECWPLILEQIPGATWHIVGKSPPPEIQRLAECPGISVTGAVPEVRSYLAAATVAIAPLRIGSGTRLKILEALAMHKAVVSTSVGCEGLVVESGKHLIVADQPRDFAQAVIDLIQNEHTRSLLGTAGRTLTETEYSWQRCGDLAIRALENMV